MEKFTVYKGLVAPLNRENVDTDAIIPKQFLKSIKKTGFGQNLFDEWRYLDHGEPGQDCSKRPVNPDFVLNQPRYKGAGIQLARKNFGCGSSREHAVWAIQAYGIRCVIGHSLAEFFIDNCLKNGVLPIELDADTHRSFMQAVVHSAGRSPVCVDLKSCQIRGPDQNIQSFDIDPHQRRMLLEGLDDITTTLQHLVAIEGWERQHQKTLE